MGREICLMSAQILNGKVCGASNFAHISREICPVSAQILSDTVGTAVVAASTFATADAVINVEAFDRTTVYAGC